MAAVRALDDGTVRWVEVCYCTIPLEEERPYWEAYFDLLAVKNAHNRNQCKDLNGTEPWACADCDCLRTVRANPGDLGRTLLTKVVPRSSNHNTRSVEDNCHASTANFGTEFGRTGHLGCYWRCGPLFLLGAPCEFGRLVGEGRSAEVIAQALQPTSLPKDSTGHGLSPLARMACSMSPAPRQQAHCRLT